MWATTGSCRQTSRGRGFATRRAFSDRGRKSWLGRGGLFVDEEMRVTIAGQAALLLLGRDHDYYSASGRSWSSPTEFRTPVAGDDWEDDWLSDTISIGQAVAHWAVLLAWDDVTREGRNPAWGHNVVLHEFAHQLDFVEDLSAGTPALGDPELESRWKYAMAVAYQDHRRAAKANESELFFTPHAAENEREFFADLTEAFYCRPIVLRAIHPELYHSSPRTTASTPRPGAGRSDRPA